MFTDFVHLFFSEQVAFDVAHSRIVGSFVALAMSLIYNMLARRIWVATCIVVCLTTCMECLVDFLWKGNVGFLDYVFTHIKIQFHDIEF